MTAKRKRVTVAEARRILTGRRDGVRCSAVLYDSKRCAADARWRVTRDNGSSFVLCGNHAATYQRMRERHPGLFRPVTVTHL